MDQYFEENPLVCFKVFSAVLTRIDCSGMNNTKPSWFFLKFMVTNLSFSVFDSRIRCPDDGKKKRDLVKAFSIQLPAAPAVKKVTLHHIPLPPPITGVHGLGKWEKEVENAAIEDDPVLEMLKVPDSSKIDFSVEYEAAFPAEE